VANYHSFCYCLVLVLTKVVLFVFDDPLMFVVTRVILPLTPLLMFELFFTKVVLFVLANLKVKVESNSHSCSMMFDVCLDKGEDACVCGSSQTRSHVVGITTVMPFPFYLAPVLLYFGCELCNFRVPRE
jgi:hypothetical protein